VAERRFAKPYRSIPPVRGTFWCGVGRIVIPRRLRKRLGVSRWHFDGLELLRESLDKGAGILLASNHSRWADPMVLGVLGRGVRRLFYYVASYHLFKQNRVTGCLINRMGGYSISREGTDRESIRASARILATAERPLVLFPVGTWFRQNDRVGPLQEGLGIIVRKAAKQTDRPVVVHPVGIKYWFVEDARCELNRRLAQLERRLGWQPQTGRGLVERVEKLGEALLVLKEIEHMGSVQPGELDERINRLADTLVRGLEQAHIGHHLGDGSSSASADVGRSWFAPWDRRTARPWSGRGRP
jgi:hypothetical protein